MLDQMIKLCALYNNLTKVLCPYCNQAAEFVTGSVVYPHRSDLSAKRFYLCRSCDAYVGCYQDGRPLGRLANRELRSEKSKAHLAFDPIWQSGIMRRGEAYTWLASQLGLSKEECHIGMFDVDLCRKVQKVCAEVIK